MNVFRVSSSALSLLFLAVLLSAASSCGNEESKEPAEDNARYGDICFLGDECGSTALSCVYVNEAEGDICTTPCNTSADCANDFICIETEEGNWCAATEPAPEPTPDLPDPDDNTPVCNTDDECAEGTYCLAGRCEEGCRADTHCKEDFLCIDNACIPVGEGCRVDEDCPIGACDTETKLCLEEPVDCDAGDEFETNNSLETATPIESSNYNALTICGGDNDFFQFEVAEAGAPLKIGLSFRHDDGDINALLLDKDGEVLLRSGSTSDNEVMERNLGAPGTYYIQVLGADPEVVNRYNLSLDVAGQNTECLADNSEPNNDRDSAATLEAGRTNLTACASDEDWFRIPVQTGQEMRAQVSSSNASALSFNLYDQSGNLLQEATPGSETLRVNAAADSSENFHLLQVTNNAPQGGADYSLSVSYTDPDAPIGNCEDRFEPNNDATRATSITPGDHQNLNLCDNGDDDDWFAIDLNAGDFIRVDLTFVHAEGDIDLSFRAPDGTTTLDSSSGRGDGESISARVLETGTYYIRAYVFGGASTSYSMNIQVEEHDGPPPCADSLEDNDNPEEASSITPGSYDDLDLCNGPDTHDWFAVELDAGDTINAELTFDDDLGNIDLYLLAPDGEQILQTAASYDDNESLSQRVFRAGTYYLRATLDSDTFNTYSLSYSVEENDGPLPCNDAFEDNNTRETAASITEGERDNLDLCKGFDDDDWFAIDLNAGDRIDVDVLFTHSEGDIDLEFFSPDNERLGRSTSSSDNENIELQVFAPGTYYLRAFVYRGDIATYSMNIQVEEHEGPPPCADPFEDNNSAAQASNITPGSHEGLDLCENSDEADWFALELGSGDTVRAEILYDTDRFLGYTLMAPNGTTILRSPTNIEGGKSITARVQDDGTYYLRVTYSGDGSVPYTLSLDIEEHTGPPLCEDTFEDNNSAVQAANITPGTYDALTLCNDSDENDWFAIDLELGDTITVTADFDHDLGNINLQLYDIDGTTSLDRSNTTEDREEVSARALADGRYFIRASMTLGDPNSYTLNIEVEPNQGTPPCEDRFENNNGAVLATAITPGTIDGVDLCSGTDEDDWFAIELNEGDLLSARALFAHDQGNIDLALVGTDGTTVLSDAESINDNESLLGLARSTGTHYLRVSLQSGRANTYSLEIEVQENDGTPPCSDRFEENDSAANATSIEPGTISDVDLCNDVDDEDWYALELTAGQTITVTMSFEHDLGDLDLNLRDTNQISNLDSSTGREDSETVTATVDEDGTYYIRAYAFNGEISPYEMQITVE